MNGKFLLFTTALALIVFTLPISLRPYQVLSGYKV